MLRRTRRFSQILSCFFTFFLMTAPASAYILPYPSFMPGHKFYRKENPYLIMPQEFVGDLWLSFLHWSNRTALFVALSLTNDLLVWLSLALFGGTLLRYAPFLYTGSWGGITPQVKLWVTVAPVIFVLARFGLRGFVLKKK